MALSGRLKSMSAYGEWQLQSLKPTSVARRERRVTWRRIASSAENQIDAARLGKLALAGESIAADTSAPAGRVWQQ